MRTARYQAMPPKSAVDSRLREKEEGEEEEGEKYLVRVALPRFPRAIRRLRAKNRLRDPLPASNSFSPCGEKERRD
ncbi:hypothetical protein B296_00035694, partial [Ensete ventricosum]